MYEGAPLPPPERDESKVRLFQALSGLSSLASVLLCLLVSVACVLAMIVASGRVR